MESGKTTYHEEGNNNPGKPLGDKFEVRSLSVQTKIALRKGGPHIRQGINCSVVCAKNVEEFIVLE